MIKKQLIKLYLSRYRVPRQMIRDAFRRYPQRTALISPRGKLTYQKLEERVNSLVQFLESAGISQGDRVFTLLADDWEQIEVRLASFEVGFVLAPFPVQKTDQAILQAARIASPSAVVFDPDLAGKLPEKMRQLFPGIIFLPTGEENAYEKIISQHQARRSSHRVRPSDPASLGFTSGTTGEPKALFTNHGVLVSSLKLTAANVDIQPGQHDTFVLGIPLVGAGSGVVLPMLFSGSTLVLPERYAAEELLTAFKKYEATRTFLTPSLLIDFLDTRKADLGSLRNVIYGTAPMPVPKLEEAVRRWGPIFQQGYGMAEVLPPVSLLGMSDHGTRENPAPRDILRSAGRVVPGVKVRIVDEDGQPLPRGVIGEIIIDSPTTFSGYWERPDLNQRVLRDGWYYTRDLGFFDQEGWLQVLGRRADVIQRNGKCIFPLQVEEAAHDHPAVKEACLVTGIEENLLVLAVSLRKNQQERISLPELKSEILQTMRRSLSPGHLPDQLTIMPELPRSYLGKVLHREVREKLAL